MNFVNAIREIEKEIRFRENKHLDEMRKWKKILKFLKEQNTACLKCGGEGSVLRKPNVNSNEKSLICNICHGTGVSEEY